MSSRAAEQTPIFITVSNDLTQDQRMHRIASSLHTAGYLVTLIGRSKSDSQPLASRPYQQQRLSTIFEQGVLFYLILNLRLFFYLLFVPKGSILYAVDLDTIWPVRWAAAIRRFPFVFDAHELFLDVPELKNRNFKRKIWSWVGQSCVPKAAARFTVGHAVQKALTERYQCEFAVLRNLPNRKKIEDHKPTQRYLWYQGVLNVGRGLELLIELMPCFPDLQLKIVGRGDIEDQLHHMANQSAAKDRITFLGWLDEKQMHEYASQAWLGFNLLDGSAESYYLSLANKTFDYIQAGLPTVHMDFPEYRAIVEQYGVGQLLSVLNIEKLRELVTLIDTDTAVYEQMKSSCITAASQLHWQQEEQIMLSRIAKLS